MDHAKQLISLGSTALKQAALNVSAKEYVLSNPILFKTLKKAADRYIGGETLDETLVKVKMQNSSGFKCSMEFMGENTTTPIEATQATDEFLRICQEIKQQSLNSTVSLDLSHIGLAISKNLCRENLARICELTAPDNIEVTISAEGTERTEDVLTIYQEASKKHPHLAITLQAYLKRTENDFKDIIKESGRIRMVKGAYETPEGLSIARGEALDERYLDYVEQLLAQKHKCAIATHHDKIQHAVTHLIEKYNTPKELYEFESLFGIQNQQLTALKEKGYPTKIYFVYGKEWYLYLCNRIAEYPLNIFRALKDIVE